MTVGDDRGLTWPATWSPTRAVGYVLGSFLVLLTCFAVFLQVRSGESPGASGSVIDVFNAGLLWMVSILAVVMASVRTHQRAAFLAWVAASAAAAGLAIDEVFEYHERTVRVVGDDDWSKILMLGGAVVAVAVLWRLESLPRGAKISLLCGIALQTAYLVTDLGDGEFFQLPIAEPVLKWVEEILELLAMQAYLVAIVLIVVTTLAPLVNLSTAAYPKRSEADELPV